MNVRDKSSRSLNRKESDHGIGSNLGIRKLSWRSKDAREGTILRSMRSSWPRWASQSSRIKILFRSGSTTCKNQFHFGAHRRSLDR